jgi:6-pyruvoyltetrahydropterin/6-carboxytetrahydropterin synthase
MFEIEKIFTFEAGHSLEHHDGKCADPHGHSYQLKIAIRKKLLEPLGPKQGMVLDYQDITAIVKPMIEKYVDHAWLNETLSTKTPTAEFMALWVYDYLKEKLPGLYRVTVCETATSSASYFTEY